MKITPEMDRAIHRALLASTKHLYFIEPSPRARTVYSVGEAIKLREGVRD